MTANKMKNVLTFSSASSGASSGITFDRSIARIISHKTICAATTLVIDRNSICAGDCGGDGSEMWHDIS